MNSTASEPIVSVQGLTKKFGQITAVNGISLQVPRGSSFAFLGPNGAGKSTTIKMLITLLQPTGGEATIDGINLRLHPSAVRRIIGYVPQLISVDGTLSAQENLLLMAGLYDIPRQERRERAREVLAFLGLTEHEKSLVRTFSGGMIRRLEIGQAILHRPKVLFLDEPTSGLDPAARHAVWQHLFELRRTYGMTIFFSTHQMEEAEEMSDDIGVMHRGNLVARGTASSIRSAAGQPNATLEEAFISLTGATPHETGNFHEIRRARHRAKTLG